MKKVAGGQTFTGVSINEKGWKGRQGDKGFGKQHKIFQIRFYFNATFT